MAAFDHPSKNIEFEEITLTTPSETITLSRELLLEYGRFVIAQPGAGRFCFGSLEKEAERLPLSYHEQGGGCLMATVNGGPAGFVAWRTLAASNVILPDAWELKRLWVRPTARGLEMGRALTQEVLDRAKETRRRAVYLDTAPASMGAAHRLYLKMGFTPCAPYNDNPVEGLAYLVNFLEAPQPSGKQ
jgi:ribosomal protein S18 acetylase RimI-like enzyme